jgi:predicted metal-binding transcription factor (methanogenesis marker protein 9)
MSAVEEILQKIDLLSDDEKRLLEQRLAERLDAEWRAEAEKARQYADERGIDQEAIDKAIHRRRYGS